MRASWCASEERVVLPKGLDLTFNINVFVAGILISVLLSALGFRESDPTLQWVVPGVVLAGATVGALFWPEKRRSRKAPPA